MRSRTLRWALLVVLGLLLAATFLLIEVRDMRRALDETSTAPPVLGRVPEFSLVDRDGSTVSLGDLAGEPWVADFVFTRCALSCPRLTSIMRRLGADAPGVVRVSFTVDPEHDTPEVLASYAESYAVADPEWHFLTGSSESLESLIVGGFKLAVMRAPTAGAETPGAETPGVETPGVETPGESPSGDPPPGDLPGGEPIVHSNRFVLVDAEGAIRGYYEVTDEADYRELLADLGHLSAGRASTGASR